MHTYEDRDFKRNDLHSQLTNQIAQIILKLLDNKYLSLPMNYIRFGSSCPIDLWIANVNIRRQGSLSTVTKILPLVGLGFVLSKSELTAVETDSDHDFGVTIAISGAVEVHTTVGEERVPPTEFEWHRLSRKTSQR